MLTTAVLLSRIQFGFTIAFHILFPAFSIGVATFLLFLETLMLKRKDRRYFAMYKFWLKVFALTFGMGIVSGIVMEFQLGTNWSGFTNSVGPLLGSLFTYEVMTAFFIEAGFLGIMLFGWNKVSPKIHYLATWCVVLGVTISAFWIMSANSWMQTPEGVHFKSGQVVVDSWLQAIFNPSVMPRFLHMMLASYISTALVVAAICAHYMIHKKHLEFSKYCMRYALVALLVLAPVQIGIGDIVGLKIHDYQPIKSAAMEGVWDTQRGAPLLLFAVPDQNKQRNLLAFGIPKLASFINTHDWNGELVGLKTVKRKDQPPVAGVFYSFRIMVGIGFIIVLLTLVSYVLHRKDRLIAKTVLLRIIRSSAPLGFIALITGWITAELGRQPWIVYGELRTNAMAAPVDTYHVVMSLASIIIVYAIIFGVFYFRYLGKIVHTGPATDMSTIEIPFGYMEHFEVEDQRVK